MSRGVRANRIVATSEKECPCSLKAEPATCLYCRGSRRTAYRENDRGPVQAIAGPCTGARDSAPNCGNFPWARTLERALQIRPSLRVQTSPAKVQYLQG